MPGFLKVFGTDMVNTRNTLLLSYSEKCVNHSQSGSWRLTAPFRSGVQWIKRIVPLCPYV